MTAPASTSCSMACWTVTHRSDRLRFAGFCPIAIAGAMLQPQSLWVLGVTAVLVALCAAFFRYSLLGKAMLAESSKTWLAFADIMRGLVKAGTDAAKRAQAGVPALSCGA